MIYRKKKTLCQTGAQCAVPIDVTQIVALMQCKCVVSAIPLHLIHFNIVQDFVHGTVQFVVLQCVQIAAHCIMQSAVVLSDLWHVHRLRLVEHSFAHFHHNHH